MHQLFVEVLTKRDLSRAGDLFLIDDKNIVTDLSILINEIQRISNSRDFNKVNNDQSVIEICLARITSAIRDSGTIEEHGPALVSLLESCLQHDLKPSKNCEDPPHAKIVSDLVSCIFLNHNKKSLMKIAIPVAVKLLHRGNKDLSRNLSSYLSIAVLNNAEILAQHIQPIIDSIIGGNYSLVRVLPRIYVVNKEPIHDHVMGLVCLLPQCETPEKLSLLNLFSLISKNKPNILESNLSQLSECLAQPQTASPTLQIMLDMAQQNPRPLAEYTNRVINACELQSGMLWMAAQFFGIVGKTNYDQACDVVHFLVSQLSRSDLSTTITLLREIKAIVEVFPSSLLPEFMHQILLQTENSSSSTVQNYLHTLHILSQQRNTSSNARAALRINCDTGYQSSFDQPSVEKSNSRCVNSIYTPNSGHPISPSHQSGKSYSHIGSTEASINRITSRINGTGSSYGSTSNNTAMARNFSSSSNGFHRSMTTLGNPSSSRHQINRRSIESIMAGTNAGSSQKSASSSYLHALYEKELSSKSSKTVATSVDSQLQQTMGNPTTNAGSSYRHYSKLSNSLNSRYRDQKAASIGGSDSLKQSRSSLLEPYSSRDAVQHFCEKHIDKIKNYMQKISVKIPLPVRCTIEEKKSKKIARLHFVCQGKGSHCLYNSTFFTMKTTTRNAPIWIHIMFLALQSKAPNPLCTTEPSVGDLKKCWDTLKADNRTFLTLVTSSFPSTRDQDMLMNELRSSRYFDVFEFNALANIWGCFLCNHPDRANEFLHENEPVIEGPLKEKKSKWKLFRRWRTHYFTLSGLHLSYRESKSKSAKPVEVGEVLSVKAIPSSRGRAIPKAFEIFTNSDKTYVLKSKSSLNNEQWVQCLSIAMAHSQAKDTSR